MKIRLPIIKGRSAAKELEAEGKVEIIDDELLVDVPDVDQLDQLYKDAYSEDSFWSKAKSQFKNIGEQGIKNALVLFYASQSKNLSLKHKAILYGALGYLITLIDAVPDLTPFFGYTDDLTVLSAAVYALIDVIDDEIKAKAEKTYNKLFHSEE